MRVEDRVEDDRYQYDREDAAERDRVQREARRAMVVREAYDAIGVAADAMFTSEPIPGQPSAFYAGERYFADEEDARRARLDLDEAQWREVERLKAVLARRARRAVWTELGRAS